MGEDAMPAGASQAEQQDDEDEKQQAPNLTAALGAFGDGVLSWLRVHRQKASKAAC